MKITYATIENMKKYAHCNPTAWSPYTDERYSAAPDDYWNAPTAWRMKDSTGHVMRLVTFRTVVEDVS